MNLDRFSQGLPDSQEANFWECPECHKEVYDMETEYCPHCVEQKFQNFRKELRMLELRYRVSVESECGGACLVDGDSGMEEDF